MQLKEHLMPPAQTSDYIEVAHFINAEEEKAVSVAAIRSDSPLSCFRSCNIYAMLH
jgi:hypothetical protein